ncbi:MAG: hypothetical protein M0023_04450 [Desulfobacteraceae bacterium]|nr:hypothetical protein [Desulfobacteraceae bacterium]
MKKLSLISILALSILIIAAAAFAITTYTVKPGQPVYADGVIVQNATAPAPLKAGNVCIVKTIHNAGDIATFNLYSSNSWYRQANWQAVKSADGSAFIVQRKLGNNTTGSVGDHGSLTVNREYSTYTLSTFGNATSASVTLCQDRN